MSNQASPSTTQRIRKRWRETRREPRRTLSSEQTSATPKQNLKVRSQQLFERVSAFVSHATVEIIPQNGFSYIRLNQEYLYESIVSPTRTFIDIRDKADYKQLHIRTAINIPHTYFTLPPVQAALRQLEETKKEESTFSCESLLSEEELQANREILKHSWVDDILQHSVQQNKHHEFLIYASYTKVKRSQVIAQIIHVLKAIYQQYIEFGQLSIFVIKTRFDKLCTERWMPLLCVSTDAYRKTQGYMDMDFTDDDVYTKILPFLYLSSSIGATNKDRLAKAGITVILNLTEREIEYPQGNFEIIHIAMADIRKQNTAGPIEKANSIIETARKNFGRVLVHCTRGQSRSPVIAIAYLMKARGWSLLKSYLFVREKRPWIGPNPSFMSQLMMYECQLHIFAPSTFPLHAYTLLESRDEDFDENILALRLTVDDSQILFNIIENNDLSYAIELVTQEPNLKYIRKTGADDETPLHSVLGLLNAGLERKQILELINLLTDVIVVTRCTLAGETPLHMAARNADKYLVDLFLKNGARVKATTLDGTNVLHCAAIWVGKTHSAEALEVLTSLVKSAGCSKVVVPDIHTFTPLDYTKLCKEAYTVILRKFVQELFIPDHSQEVTKENIRNNICLIVHDILCTLIWQELYNQFFHDQMKHDPILQCLVLQYHEFCSICQKILPADLCPQGKGHREISEFEVIDFLIEVVKKIIISQPNNLFFENVNSLLPNEIDSYGIVMCHPDVFKLVLNSDTNIVNDTIQTVFPSLNCKQIANILQSASKILYEAITEVSAQEN